MAKVIVDRDLERISQLVQTVLHEPGYRSIERMGGLTNRTYHISLEDGREYVIRIPGEGTQELIVRSDEFVSNKLACRLGIDANLLYFGEDGSKVTEYIPNAVTMCAEELAKDKHIKLVAKTLKVIHNCGEDTGVLFEVFDMATSYENIINSNNVPMFDDYQEKKQMVMNIKAMVDAYADIHKVPCHNDPLCENWVMGDDRMYLIDWEYGGMNDGMWDVADISIEAGFGEMQDRLLLTEYLDREPTVRDMKHFLASKIYVDYLWTLWAKTRVPYDGQPMEDWAQERYLRMKTNIDAFRNLQRTEGVIYVPKD